MTIAEVSRVHSTSSITAWNVMGTSCMFCNDDFALRLFVKGVVSALSTEAAPIIAAMMNFNSRPGAETIALAY